MADAPYLIALALMSQDGRRAMPLQGRSLREPISSRGDPGDDGRQQVFELLLRIWQRSDEAPLQRASDELGLLVIEVPIEALQDDLPRLKAAWLNTGDDTALVSGLGAIAVSVWRLALQPRTPMRFERLS